MTAVLHPILTTRSSLQCALPTMDRCLTELNLERAFEPGGAIEPGSRSAVLRRSERTRFLSASDDEVGEFQRDPQRRSEQ